LQISDCRFSSAMRRPSLQSAISNLQSKMA